jgi:folylpolyglutamate synthase/dihydropteroate synthase
MNEQATEYMKKTLYNSQGYPIDDHVIDYIIKRIRNDQSENDTIVDKYKKFIHAIMEFEDENDDTIIAGSIKSIESISRVIENRLCELVPEYKAELDELDK